MEVVLGGLTAQRERPQTQKFAWPIVTVPEIFTARRHLAMLVGYLTSIGWEVYALELPWHEERTAGGLAQRDFAGTLTAVAHALDSIDKEVILVGHGVGGLVALKLADHNRVKASVALAPLMPGAPSPLFSGLRHRWDAWRGASLKPPRGRTLFEFVADADPFQRAAIIRTLVPADFTIVRDIVAGKIALTHERPVPRLIVAGDSDIFATTHQMNRLAELTGARLVTLPGRGHWLIGGRALERVVGEMQRFLVRALGQDLLLLYLEQLRTAEGDDENG